MREALSLLKISLASSYSVKFEGLGFGIVLVLLKSTKRCDWSRKHVPLSQPIKFLTKKKYVGRVSYINFVIDLAHRGVSVA